MLQAILNKQNLVPVIHANTEKKNAVKPCDLDIYYEPEQAPETDNPPPSPVFLYEHVSTVRKSLTGPFSGLLNTHVKVSNFFNSIESRLVNAYNDTISDPYFLLSPGAIALATLAGATVAGRGRRPFKRSLYAIVFGVTATSVCYPDLALDIATTGYYHTTASISKLGTFWTERNQTITGTVMEKSEEREREIEVEAVAEIAINVEKELADVLKTEEITTESVVDNVNEIAPSQGVIDIIAAEKAAQQQELKVVRFDVIEAIRSDDEAIHAVTAKDTSDKTDKKSSKDEIRKVDVADDSVNVKVEGDYGQSDPSDKDMYSTRS